ncbi:uncharacterized protein SAPINGB_P005474 [Magnusiomyces paraingens]|uniref:glycogenin glucosyltransferase n=1 Tax=Magnusiomyces paraingens TaxID=2606893 RepID=A0A5E8BZR6_9ASCO|nr:uncharacterized protein SAPINGB_P005474 [Saprochaete ingens]VVT56987.1 unnamed protein product [Saprochaete ingens]
MSSEAYCTLLYNDSYLPGALVLGHALRDAGTTKQLAIIVGPEVSTEARNRLLALYDHLLPTETIAITQADAPQFKLLGRPDLERSYTKINVWLQTQFSKIVFLDADTLPLKNIDDLFDRYPLSHSSIPIAAAPDIGWPDIFNSGVFVTLPNKDTFEALSGRARAGLSFDGGDQGLLNQFFQDKWHHLPFVYNVTPSASYQYTPAYNFFKDQVAIVHFIGSSKPWSQSLSGPASNASSFEHSWWEVYNKHYDSSLNLKSPEIIATLPLDSAVENVYTQIVSDSTDDHGPNFIPTIEPDVNRWDPTRYLPPRNSKPEALNLVISHYENIWDHPPKEDPVYNKYVEHQHMHYDPHPAPPPAPPHPPIHHHDHHCHHVEEFSHSESHEEHHEEHHEEYHQEPPHEVHQESYHEPEPPVKPVFPWETQERHVERVFPEDYGYEDDYHHEEEEEEHEEHQEGIYHNDDEDDVHSEDTIDAADQVTRQFRDYSIQPQYDSLDTRRTTNVWDSDPKIQSYISKVTSYTSDRIKRQAAIVTAVPVTPPKTSKAVEEIEEAEAEEDIEEGIEEADDELKHHKLVHTKIKEQNEDGVIMKREGTKYRVPDQKASIGETSGFSAKTLNKIDAVTQKREDEGAPLYFPVTPNPIKLREQGISGGLSDASSEDDEGEDSGPIRVDEQGIDELEEELDAGEEAIDSLPVYTDEEEVALTEARKQVSQKTLRNIGRRQFANQPAEPWDPYKKLEELAQLANLLAQKQAEFERVYGEIGKVAESSVQQDAETEPVTQQSPRARGRSSRK